MMQHYYALKPAEIAMQMLVNCKFKNECKHVSRLTFHCAIYA